MGVTDFFVELYKKYTTKLPDAEAYLRRIGIGEDEDIPLTKEGLDRVQFAHLCTIPFENLDIFDYDEFIDFQIDDLFEKIVVKCRGGYCFELNAMFMALLSEIGFDVHPIGVRILMGDGEPEFRPITHRATIVTIGEKRYYADVGFGATYAPGMSLDIDTSEKQHFENETYSVEDRPYNNKIIFRHTEQGPSNLFSFVPDPFNILDFVSFNTTVQAKAFRDKRMVNLRRPGGSISVDGDIFRTTQNNQRTEKHLPGGEDALETLNKEFGMKLSKKLGDRAFIPAP